MRHCELLLFIFISLVVYIIISLYFNRFLERHGAGTGTETRHTSFSRISSHEKCRGSEDRLALANEGAAESRGLTPSDSMLQIKTRTL